MEKIKPIPIGVEFYKEMIDKGYYYVDKTLLIRDLLELLYVKLDRSVFCFVDSLTSFIKLLISWQQNICLFLLIFVLRLHLQNFCHKE